MTQKQQQAKEKKKQDTKELHEFFQQLWDRMPKKKNCQSCGAPIWGENKTYYWDHLLTQQKYPECRLMDWCLYFCCLECHQKRTNGHPTENHAKAIEKAQQHYKMWREGLELYEKQMKS